MLCYSGVTRLLKGLNPQEPTQEPTQVGNYLLGNTLNSGAYGEVKEAHDVVSGSRAAVKVIHGSKMSPSQLRNEVDNQRLCEHENVVRIFDVHKLGKHTCIIMEFVEGGDACDYLDKQGPLGEKEARRLFRQLIAGLENCHSRGVAHRDVKLENLMLDSENNLKIADFGLAAKIVKGQPLTDMVGTLDYAAPEILRIDCNYDGPEVDVWSCGVVLYALLTNAMPFNGFTDAQIQRNIQRGQFAQHQNLSLDAYDLLRKIFNTNRNNRITIEEIRKHPWFHEQLHGEHLLGEARLQHDVIIDSLANGVFGKNQRPGKRTTVDQISLERMAADDLSREILILRQLANATVCSQRARARWKAAVGAVSGGRARNQVGNVECCCNVADILVCKAKAEKEVGCNVLGMLLDKSRMETQATALLLHGGFIA